MAKPLLSIICAIGKNKAIGKNNKLLWDIPNDLQHFKEITKGHPVIIGRKTFESIGKPLPDRTNIIITRDENYKQEGCVVCHSLECAIKVAKEKDKDEVFVIGGGSIYAQAIKSADKLYLTIVDDIVEDADTFFPEYSDFKFINKGETREYNGIKYKFVELVRSNA